MESANDSGGVWCTTFRVANTAGAANQRCDEFAVVINELVYDGALGADTMDPRKTFVELAGPGGGQLANLRLRGVEGEGASAGVTQAPAVRLGTVAAGVRNRVDGLFVIADNSGGASQTVPASERDLETAFDPENGVSDALQLLFDDTTNPFQIVDALRYGPSTAMTDTTNMLPIVEGTHAIDVN